MLTLTRANINVGKNAFMELDVRDIHSPAGQWTVPQRSQDTPPPPNKNRYQLGHYLGIISPLFEIPSGSLNSKFWLCPPPPPKLETRSKKSWHCFTGVTFLHLPRALFVLIVNIDVKGGLYTGFRALHPRHLIQTSLRLLHHPSI